MKPLKIKTGIHIYFMSHILIHILKKIALNRAIEGVKLNFLKFSFFSQKIGVIIHEKFKRFAAKSSKCIRY